MPKGNKLGIHKKIEETCLNILTRTIDASLRSKQDKIPYLAQVRRDIEVLKHLVRIEYELGVIKEKTYLVLAHILQDISMMATGWQKSVETKIPI